MAESEAERFRRRVRALSRSGGGYAPEAFLFVGEAVGATAKWIREGELAEDDPVGGRQTGAETFHISGRELLAGLRRLAWRRWGRMAGVVLAQWGLRRSEDVGEVVFRMVEDPEMGWSRREGDTRADFAGGGDLTAAFNRWDEP